MKKNWEDKPFHDELLYVVDGELLNHMIMVMILEYFQLI